MISVLVLSAVYCGFIGGVMISVLVLSVVYCGFIGGVMISVLVFNHYTTNEPTIYHT
jgi:uncharacterized protein YneF (UPF0154 family)